MLANRGRRRIAIMLSAAAFIWLCGAGPGAAGDADEPKCEGGERRIANFGLWELRGKMNIDVWGHSEHPLRVIRFLSEPVVGAVDPEGPSYGKIKPGDVIVAIGGELITTEPAGFLFMMPPGGSPVELTVRRDGVEKNVTIAPTEICENDPRSFFSNLAEPAPLVYRRPNPPGELGEPPAPPAAPRPEGSEPERPSSPSGVERPERPKEPTGFPHPWMGIGLKCSIEGNWYSKDLRFTKPPKVFNIEPGSNAEKAGLRTGDVITRIDGIPMDTLEGTDRFVNVQPGDTVDWTVLRDGKQRTIEMKAEPIPKWAKYFEEGREAPSPEEAANALRYSGRLGETAIEVRGAAPVNVKVDYALGLVTIRTPDTTIRLKTVEKRDDD